MVMKLERGAKSGGVSLGWEWEGPEGESVRYQIDGTTKNRQHIEGRGVREKMKNSVSSCFPEQEIRLQVDQSWCLSQGGRCLSAAANHVQAMRSRQVARSAVWWR